MPVTSLKSLIKNSPFEAPARFVYRALGGGNEASRLAEEWSIRDQRDQVSIDRMLQARLNAASNCIDIGANEGVFLKRFQSLAPQGHHMAFEPIPRMAAALKASFPNADVRQCALGASTGQTTFCYLPTMPGWSGLKRQPYPGNAQPQEITIDIFRLDDLVPADARVDFIKIDVEGAEFEVLRGAGETIKRTRPYILFEHAQVHNTEYGTTPGMIHELLSDQYGLNIYLLDGTGPLSREELAYIYQKSHASRYNRSAQTNFIARPD